MAPTSIAFKVKGFESVLSKGCESFNIPIMRKRSEAWRHFDVDGILAEDFSSQPPKSLPAGFDLESVRESLEASRHLLPSEEVAARLVYIDNVFVPSLSIQEARSDDGSSFSCYNASPHSLPSHFQSHFTILPDAVTDDLPYKPTTTRNVIPISTLSGEHHMVGPFNSQSAVNNQQGIGGFAALNSIKCEDIAVVDVPEGAIVEKPIQIIRLVSPSGVNAAVHPRAMIICGDSSSARVVQSNVDLSEEVGPTTSTPGPTLVNSFTQALVGEKASLAHSFIEESGGLFESFTEEDDDSLEREANRPQLKNTNFENIHVHVNGQGGSYESTLIGASGNGRAKICMCAHQMETETHVGVNGLALAGGAQSLDMRTNIHHIAAGCTSAQAQRNVVGGRSTVTFKGRIRVEQSAQQTDSDQLARSLLLNEKSRVWCMPSLEIIADDVKCTHGATISDLSEEELFYLRSRGLSRELSRNLQLNAFVAAVSEQFDDAYLGDNKIGLRRRLKDKLMRIVPRGERQVLGEYSSV